MALDYTVIVAYLLGMVAMGWWGIRRVTTKSEYLLAPPTDLTDPTTGT